MPPKPALLALNATQEKWVTVTWMPHTTLSQTSHVCLVIKSAHILLDPLNDREPQEWKVRVSVYGNAGLPILPLSSHTTASILQNRDSRVEKPCRPTAANATHDCYWNYFLQIPIRWRDLPRDAYLLFEILGRADAVECRATMPFFSTYGRMATGLQHLELQFSPLDPDRNYGLTPTVHDVNEIFDDPVIKASHVLDQIEKNEQSLRGFPTFGRTPRVPWLDELSKERALKTIEQVLTERKVFCDYDEADASLFVELPEFEIPIIYEEMFYPVPQTGASGAVAPLDLSNYRKKSQSLSEPNKGEEEFDPLQLVQFVDYEDEHDNPVEDKYRTLAHDLLRGLVDPALKPDREQRDRLAAIIDSPSHHPTREEKDLLWRFRFSLVDNRRALTKFLLAVDWTVESEVVQAAELLEQWRKRSPIEVTDALKLLGKHVAFQTNLVRAYAIDTLAAAPDSELRLYLLQLVQALKYENTEAIDSDVLAAVSGGNSVSSLATFLIDRAAGNIELANYLYWYLKVEVENPTHGARYREIFEALQLRLSDSAYSPVHEEAKIDDNATAASFKSIVDSMSKFGSTLRGSESRAEIGTSEKDSSKKSTKVRTMWDVLVAQDEFISGVLRVQERCRDARGKKDAKEAELKATLAKEGFGRKAQRNAVPLPSSPDIWVTGIVPETAKMFKSALYPALVEFNVGAVSKHSIENKGSLHHQSQSLTNYKVIVKTGDDLRQDQLIIMMIQLMDRLLKRAALDLCLTPYSILATSASSGLVEFVDGSIPISQVLSSYNNSVQQYFQTVGPQNGAKYGIRPDVLSTYVRSCAGYCVITYLLGVGDRHLDNILLRSSGHFFHIDFGFIFGRDPKPLPPAFRLTREMVDGMGGIDSTEYKQFMSLACQAFNALRKSAGLILNLLHLMSDAGIEDLSNNPTADSEGVLAKVEERFRLDLTDEQAERYFVGLINDCLAAIAPRVMDVFHSFAVARR